MFTDPPGGPRPHAAREPPADRLSRRSAAAWVWPVPHALQLPPAGPFLGSHRDRSWESPVYGPGFHWGQMGEGVRPGTCVTRQPCMGRGRGQGPSEWGQRPRAPGRPRGPCFSAPDTGQWPSCRTRWGHGQPLGVRGKRLSNSRCTWGGASDSGLSVLGPVGFGTVASTQVSLQGSQLPDDRTAKEER